MKNNLLIGAITLISSSMYGLYNEPVTTRENLEFSIKLSHIKGTGYDWELENAAEIKNYVKLVSTKFESTTDKIIPGTRGRQIFTFKALRPGYAYLMFAKKRSWEKNKAPKARKEIKVLIKRGR